MPWFCSELIAEYKPALLNDWRQVDAFKGRLYLVTDLAGHDFYRPENEHGLPARGLLFVRDLESAPWRDDAGDYSLIASIPHRAAELAIECPPTHETLLRFAKNCSTNFRCMVAHYSASSWGGPLEAEEARVFLPFERRIYRDKNREMTMTQAEDGAISEDSRDHLSVTLEYSGVHSPSGYFAPHTSHFEWDRFAVQ